MISDPIKFSARWDSAAAGWVAVVLIRSLEVSAKVQDLALAAAPRSRFGFRSARSTSLELMLVEKL
jgi:hypothetical protein